MQTMRIAGCALAGTALVIACAEQAPVDVAGRATVAAPAFLHGSNPANSNGAVVFRGSTIEQYMAQYPNHEANCCPPYFLKRTIRFLDGAYRVTATAQVSPSEVPASQL